MARVLVIDDDEMLCQMVCRTVGYMDHEARYALTLGDGAAVFKEGDVDVTFLDVRLPDGNGLTALPALRQEHPGTEFIIITGEADLNDAELAIKSGAWDYVKKPISASEVKLQLTRALEYQSEKAARRTAVSLKRQDLAGDSAPMAACLDLLVQAASSDASVLVSGETGTGKELFCRAIHENSFRADKAFVVVDCASLPETLLESVLFGHVKGAFTGADRSQTGLIKQADGGTLFLDEIGELPLSMQKAFLRVLQEHRFRPVGGQSEEHSAFRLVAATNRDLRTMSNEGLFRSDLLFRVQSLVIELPPLREHREDIPEILDLHIGRLCKGLGIPVKEYAADFFEALEAYDWPGNVRELVSVVETAIAAARDEHTLFAQHLPMAFRVARTQKALGGDQSPTPADEAENAASPLPCFRDYRKAGLEEVERRYLERLVNAAGGSHAVACRLSGLSKSRIYQLLQKYGLSLTR